MYNHDSAFSERLKTVVRTYLYFMYLCRFGHWKKIRNKIITKSLII